MSEPAEVNGSVDYRSRSVEGGPHHIALFTGNYNHLADGVSLTLNRLVDHLETYFDARVMVFGPTVDDPPVDHKGTFIPVPSVPAPGRSEYRITLGFPRSAQRAFKAFRPDLVHIATPDLLGLRALCYAKRMDIPVVASYHTHFSSYLKYYGISSLDWIVWSYLRWFYHQCRHVYVPTESIAGALKDHGITEGLRLWERGVDTHQFAPRHRSMVWRRQHGIDSDEVVVSFVGRLVWEKGLDVYASVIERLREKELKFKSLIVGDGPAQAALRKRLPDAIFTGHLQGDALSRAYASSDLFLFPSDTETFGNVTLEAMASGLPTVCADANGSNALVEDGETGFLAPPGSIDGFADRVVHLIEDPGLRYRMGERARKKAEKYNWFSVMSRMACFYDEVLDTRIRASADGRVSSLSEMTSMSAA